MSGKGLITRPRNSISVCYLIDVLPGKFRGGGQTHLVNLVRRLKRPGLAAAARPGLNIFGGQGPQVILRFFWMIYVIPQVIFHYFFLQRFDLIHAHSVPAMAAGKILSLILGIPIVVTVHGAWMKSWLEKIVLTKIKYDAQITVSRNFLEVPNINKNVVYIPNGVDLDVFKGPALPRQGRALSHKIVLSVGRMNDPAKGFKILEEAMKLVEREVPEAKLLVADGSVPETEVVKMYWAADLFVLPSLSEGFPLTLLEAWAAKLPVVATAVGEIPHLFGVGSFANFQQEVYETANGYVVKPGNVKSLAKAITLALSNKHLDKLGENGYNLAKEYTWERVARETLKVYQKIC